MSNHDRKMQMWKYIASMMTMGITSAGQLNPTEAKRKAAKGAYYSRSKCLPGGLRGMSQRQRRKRVRWGILDG